MRSKNDDRTESRRLLLRIALGRNARKERTTPMIDCEKRDNIIQSENKLIEVVKENLANAKDIKGKNAKKKCEISPKIRKALDLEDSARGVFREKLRIPSNNSITRRKGMIHAERVGFFRVTRKSFSAQTEPKQIDENIIYMPAYCCNLGN